MGDYFSLLKENRFQIHPARYPMAGLVGMSSVVNSGLAAVQRLAFKKKIDAAKLHGPPVFIVGHWRSGTTLMHELISLDPRFNFPSNFEAFIPTHFLVSRPIFYPLVHMLLPRRRPMDNMSISASSPQEDDFALIGYGVSTPYRRIAFANRINRDHLELNFDNASPVVERQLHDAMETFLKSLTLRYQSRLVMKSPPHTGRISQLAKWFPDAKFIHLSRHPHKLVPSTMRLWKLLDVLQSFQVPKYDDTWLKNYIFECKDLMYASYFEHRSEIPTNRLVEVRFEDLVAEPIQQLEKAYEQLELGGFEDVKPNVLNYFEQKKSHKKNEHQLDEKLKLEIDSNWQEYMSEFGYQSQ